MRCPYCNRGIYPNMTTCPECGATLPQQQTPPPSQAPYPQYASQYQQQYQQATPAPSMAYTQAGVTPDLIPSSWHKKWIIALLGLATTGFGALVFWWVFQLLFFIPPLILVFLYVMVLFPVVGALLIVLGYFKVGAIILFVGSGALVPVGIIGLFGGWAAWRLAKLKAKHDRHEVRLDLAPDLLQRIKQPTSGLRLLGLLGIAAILIVPGAFYADYLSKPQLRIMRSDVPSYIYGSTAEITIELTNIGGAVAEGEHIEIKIQISGEIYNYRWTGGDVGPGQFVEDSFSVSVSSDDVLGGITVYYNGQKHHNDTSLY